MNFSFENLGKYFHKTKKIDEIAFLFGYAFLGCLTMLLWQQLIPSPSFQLGSAGVKWVHGVK